MAVARDERATSFGAAAESYDRYRPAPPPEVARWMLPPGAVRVADVGAGTGGFSRVLAGQVDHVVAVELDRRMAAVLSARSPKVTVVNAPGEVLPLRSACLDAVLVSSAWHWLDPARALPEIARVVRPGGVLGVVWSGPDRETDWVQQLLSGARPAGPSGASDGPRKELSIPPGLPFGPPEQWEYRWSLLRTRSELIGLAGTYSRVITSAAEERAAVIAGAAEVVETHPRLREQAEVELPMSSRCWRAVRN